MGSGLYEAAFAALVPLYGPGSRNAITALLHGTGNGILTIAKGTLPLVMFGPVGYGAPQGLILAPSRFAQALAPLLFGLCLDHWGAGALWVSATLGLLAHTILMGLRRAQAVSG